MTAVQGLQPRAESYDCVGRLQAAGAMTGAMRQRLQQAVAAAERMPGATVGLSLARPGGMPLTLRVSRGPNAGRALVQCIDPHDTQVDAALLPTLFGLTPSEAAVAAALCDGLSPQEMAARLGVQTNTVNAHLKKVLAKTGMRRQVQLVSLLLRSAACATRPLPPPHEPGAPHCPCGQ